MSYGFQPPPYQQGAPPYQPGVPPYQSGVPPYQPGAPSAPMQQGFPPPYQPGVRCAVIRNTSSGLCLDGSEYDVKLQHYTGLPMQQWYLEPIGDGRFIIVNKANGAALDMEGGPDCGTSLITYEKHGGLNQQWYLNPDFTIVSAAGNLAVDVCEGNCYPGNILIAYERHGGPNQQFQVQYQ